MADSALDNIDDVDHMDHPDSRQRKNKKGQTTNNDQWQTMTNNKQWQTTNDDKQQTKLFSECISWKPSTLIPGHLDYSEQLNHSDNPDWWMIDQKDNRRIRIVYLILL